VVGYPFVTINHVSRMSEQRGMFSAITRTCETLPDNSAVVMLPEIASAAYLNDPQTLRGFCNVPVARMKAPVSILALRQLRDEWKDGAGAGTASGELSRPRRPRGRDRYAPADVPVWGKPVECRR
jgi:hypothetical protein